MVVGVGGSPMFQERGEESRLVLKILRIRPEGNLGDGLCLLRCCEQDSLRAYGRGWHEPLRKTPLPSSASLPSSSAWRSTTEIDVLGNARQRSAHKAMPSEAVSGSAWIQRCQRFALPLLARSPQ